MRALPVSVFSYFLDAPHFFSAPPPSNIKPCVHGANSPVVLFTSSFGNLLANLTAGLLAYWIRRRPPEPEIPGSSPGQLKVIAKWTSVGEVCRRPNLARTQTSETGCVCLRRHSMPKDTPPGCSPVQLTNAWRLPAPRDHD